MDMDFMALLNRSEWYAQLSFFQIFSSSAFIMGGRHQSTPDVYPWIDLLPFPGRELSIYSIRVDRWWGGPEQAGRSLCGPQRLGTVFFFFIASRSAVQL
jgi:hypothetical protein